MTPAEQDPAIQDIAIIGMAGRFPGAEDVDAFWRNISTGVESFTRFTDEQLLAAGEDPTKFGDPNYVRCRPVLDNIRGWDAAFFGSSPREATLADPQQRLFVECVWEVLEAAGYATPQDRGVVGVFAGMNISTYLLSRPNAFSMGVEIDGLMVGNDKDALATNVSYRLDLRGPSVTVQTFCSTSLVAIHLASESLRRGECEMALAGGVSIQVPDQVGYMFHEGNQASPDGHVRTFDEQARGSMFGDGIAVVVLKPLDKAVADRDTVLAVLRGSAINNDGALKFSFQAPSIDGQRRCVSAALARAGVRPADISYVEAHGTATVVGDPMEVAALTAAFGPTETKQYCLLGSVKPNVGHLDRASGATGLIKVVQALRHELIPGTRNFVAPNPEIDFANSPFRVTAEPTPWLRQADRPRIAGLSSLGTGGTNAHAIVEEAPLLPERRARSRRWQVVPLSARSEPAADLACAKLATGLAEQPDLDLGDVAFTLQVGRRVFNHKRIVVSDTATGAAAKLADPAVRAGRADAVVGRRVGLLIAGVGEQYPGLVADLYADEPSFAADVDACLAVLGLADAAALSDLFVPAQATDNGSDLARLLGRSTEPANETGDARWIQPAVFVAEYALARLLQRWGIQPELMLGYSLGEYVAACLSGVLSLTDALRLVAHRAELIAALPGGAMLAAGADESRVHDVLGAELVAELDVAVRTGSQLVLAGAEPAIEAAHASLVAAEVGCRRLRTTHAFHSRMLLPAAAELTDWVAANVTLNAPTLPYLSNVTGELATEKLVTDPGYWARHMCETVQFDSGLAHVLGMGDLVLLELGAGQSLGALTRGHPACRPAQFPLVVATLPAAADRRDVHLALAESVGRLWLTGVPIDWPALHADDAGWTPGRVPLPTYPFERQEYWLEAEPTAPAGAGQPAFDFDDPTSILTALPKLPEEHWTTVPVWQQTMPRPVAPEASSWLVFTDVGRADELVAPLRGAAAPVTLVRPGQAFAETADGFTVRPGSAPDVVAVLRALAREGRSPQRVIHLWTADAHANADDLPRGLHTLLAIAQAAADQGLPPWTLDVVTSDGQRVLPGDRVRPGTGTLVGPTRLIPVEYPGVRTRLIDIDIDTDPATTARTLLAELRGDPVDQIVALRGGRRWVPGYDVLDATRLDEAPPVVSIRPGGSYLVTGGLGGIGLAMAERLAQTYRARLVLMGRTPIPPREQWGAILAADTTAPEVRRRIEGLTRVVAAGGDVVTVAGDVSRPADVRRAVNAALESYGELHGVLHCAGVPAVGLMQFKTPADMDKVLAPKVAGSRALVEALSDVPVDFLVLFSSTTSATGGGAGQVDYCAANAFLDTYAQSDPLPGRLVTSIDWGEWTWNGWTTGLDSYDEGSKDFFTTYRATFGIGFDEGFRTLERVLAGGEPHVVVSTQDFPTLVAMSRRSSIQSHQATVKKARLALGAHPRPELSTGYVEPQTPAEQAIATVWTEALGLDRVGVHDNFFELGGNSLIGMEIIAQIRAALALDYLPPHLLYEAPTVAALAAAAEQPNETSAPDTPGPSAGDRNRSRIEARRSSLRTRRTA